MKSLNTYICESLLNNPGVVNTVRNVVQKLVPKLSELDTIRTEENNVAKICDELKSELELYDVMTLDEYYSESINKFKSRTDCALRAGNIILRNINNKKEYHFYIKVSKKFFGEISMNSIVNFDEDGYYIFAIKSTKTVRIVDHSRVISGIKLGDLRVNQYSDNENSTLIKFNGKNYRTTDYLNKVDLAGFLL